MDKEKEIEELRQAIAEYSCNKRCTESCDRRGFCCIKRFVTNIIDAGCRIIPEGAVVLTKEELNDRLYQSYSSGVNFAGKQIEDQKEKACKETAKEILTDIANIIDRTWGELNGDDLKMVADKYGVEVDE